jgi:hypothetical protein
MGQCQGSLAVEFIIVIQQILVNILILKNQGKYHKFKSGRVAPFYLLEFHVSGSLLFRNKRFSKIALMSYFLPFPYSVLISFSIKLYTARVDPKNIFETIRYEWLDVIFILVRNMDDLKNPRVLNREINFPNK